jgi:hypothetical protein
MTTNATAQRNQKGAEPDCPPAPAKGRTEQCRPAPLAGRGSVTASVLQEPQGLRLAVLAGQYLTLARRSNCRSSAIPAVDRYTVVVALVLLDLQVPRKTLHRHAKKSSRSRGRLPQSRTRNRVLAWATFARRLARLFDCPPIAPIRLHGLLHAVQGKGHADPLVGGAGSGPRTGRPAAELLHGRWVRAGLPARRHPRPTGRCRQFPR